MGMPKRLLKVDTQSFIQPFIFHNPGLGLG